MAGQHELDKIKEQQTRIEELEALLESRAEECPVYKAEKRMRDDGEFINAFDYELMEGLIFKVKSLEAIMYRVREWAGNLPGGKSERSHLHDAIITPTMILEFEKIKSKRLRGHVELLRKTLKEALNDFGHEYNCVVPQYGCGSDECGGFAKRCREALGVTK